jgi:putative DNA modification/repair radical SAM protein
MDVQAKLRILADAAKYDASCASSGSQRERPAGGVGNTERIGICHSYTPDGRCVSLLKILLTNYCVYDCIYCVNRVSSDVPRARFTPEEVVWLTLEFYRRNYIEGLFLSSGIIQSPDYTMEQLIAVARSLREQHRYGGYIHLKAAAGASPELIQQAGQWADRLSANIELPRPQDLVQLAPAKTHAQIEGTMHHFADATATARDLRRRNGDAPRFAPAGQSTQMVVGATDANDGHILAKASELYNRFKLRRVYYSAFSPIPHGDPRLPLKRAPLLREHRLYQADWLLRFYGFTHDELTSANQPDLSLTHDPKLAWALRNRHRFPVNIQTGAREELLRIPGIGARNVKRLLSLRRLQAITLEDLRRLSVAVERAKYFVITADHNPGVYELDRASLPRKLAAPAKQLSLFGAD